MKQDNVVGEKSLLFAVRIVNLCRYLRRDKEEYVLSKQLLRSGTSIGANVHEAFFGQSREDFLSKMHIALKEVSETQYWLTLLFRTEYLSDKAYESISEDCRELTRILISITKTTKENLAARR